MIRSLRWVRAHPFSVSLTLTISLTAVMFGTVRGLDPSWLAAGPAALSRGLWWTPVTMLLVPDSLVELVITAALCLTVLAYAERLLGTLRALALFAVTGISGALLGIAVQILSDEQGAVWARTSGTVLDPAVGVAGTIMAASALAPAPALWRRRLRLLGFAILLMFTLYGGDVDSVYRLAGALIGSGAGMLLAHRTRPPAGAPHGHSSYGETRALIATIVAVTGVGPLIVLLTGRGVGPLSPVIAGLRGVDIDSVVNRCSEELSDRCAAGLAGGIAPLLMSLVPLVLTVIAAVGLRSGRRAAWMLALGVNAVMAVVIFFSIGRDEFLHPSELTELDRAFPGFAMIAIAVPIGMCVLLLVSRRRFAVRAAPGSGRRFAYTALAALIALAVIDVGITVLAGISAVHAVLDLPRRFLPIGFVHPHLGLRLGVLGVSARSALGPLYWVLFSLGMLRLLRSVPEEIEQENARFRSLLRIRSGTLGFLGTWEGSRHWFTTDGGGAVAYRLISGFAITVGDPVGQDPVVTAQEFARFCDRQGWGVVLYSVHSEVRDALRTQEWGEIPVAEETIIPLRAFSLEGRAWAKVRQPYHRAHREGLRAEWTRWQDLTPAVATQIEALSEQWIAEKALPEMGFTLGGMDELKDPEVMLMLAVGGDGGVQAITSWLPVYEGGELVGRTLDFMRRTDAAMPGATEFLIAASALQLKAEGATIMSLSGGWLPHQTPRRKRARSRASSTGWAACSNPRTDSGRC